MPTSLSIGAFVLGAVLLLLSLVSGGFKIFGAEVSGTAGSRSRLVSFFLGIVFIVVGFSAGDENKSKASEREVEVTAQRAERPPATEATLAPVAPAVKVNAAQYSNHPKLSVKWTLDVNAMQSIMTQTTEAERVNVFINAMASGMDIYAARVTISNVGDSTVKVSPESVRMRLGQTALRSGTLDHPEFLRITSLDPKQYVEGLLLFQAPILGVGLENVRLSYEDPAVTVSYVQ